MPDCVAGRPGARSLGQRRPTWSKRLLKVYAEKKVIHVILDNSSIHSSPPTQQWLAEHGQKFRRHFLASYDPDDNRMERKLCRAVHAKVTVNHQHEDIDTLCDDVVQYMMAQNRKAVCVHESRAAI